MTNALLPLAMLALCWFCVRGIAQVLANARRDHEREIIARHERRRP